MSPIRILATEIVDRIAAGEVVERPASVVKELIENSLDAGARRIEIRLEGGGRDLVEIVDDGHGMSDEDARLAFVQHATSKIERASDLEHVGSLGFRGEALASIAAVARVEMVTGTGRGPGTRVRVEDGGQRTLATVATPRGTRLRVRDLFFNTPARRKHLRTATAESTRAAAVVNEFALLRPDVHFRLVISGRERLDAPPVEALRERVLQVLGAEVADAWLPVDDTGPRIRVSGGTTAPEHHRADRRHVHLFVNGRVINDGRLVHAVVSAYDRLLDRGRYPVSALFLEMPLEDVDVNVHPRKAEVRFVDPGRVYGAIRRALQRSLAYQLPPPAIAFGPQGPASGARDPGAATTGCDPAGTVQEVTLPLRDWRSLGEGSTRSEPPRSGGDAEALPVAPIAGTTGAIQPLAQYANTYIVAADDAGLLLVDQHVAHERILYEQVLARQQQRAVPAQRLLVPETFDLDPSEATVAENTAELLATFGFEIEPFGGSTWAVRTVPEILQARSAERVIRAILAELAGTGAADTAEAARRGLAASIACHSAVRANQPLSGEVQSYLLRELARCEVPNRCPHGRPIMLRIEHRYIERLLHRH